MGDNFSVFNNSKLHFKKSGQGKKVLLAFHGFGQDHTAFDLLATTLNNQYTIYAFDLYFHGKSEWGYHEKPLERTFWQGAMHQFLTENNITKFSLTGFSMGCRLALATAKDFPEQTEALFLLAPDGIKTSFWYSLSTYPLVMRKVFKYMITHPIWFDTLANTLRKTGILDKGLIKFAEYQMNSEAKRRKLYNTWVVFRHIKINLKSFVSVVNEKRIPVLVAVGKTDQVIPATTLKTFVNQLKTGKFITLNTGHTGLLKDASLSILFNTANQ